MKAVIKFAVLLLNSLTQNKQKSSPVEFNLHLEGKSFAWHVVSEGWDIEYPDTHLLMSNLIELLIV